jgi:hypothetical protein
MKHLLASILLLPALSFAQSGPVTVDKKVVCETTEVAFRALLESNPAERPFWTGSSGSSRYALLVDEKTGSWTLIQFNSDMACVIDLGTDHGTKSK